MAVKEVCPDIKTLSKSEWARDGFVRVELWKNGEYNIDAQIGGDRAVQQTDRASIIALRDALNELLDATEPADDPLADIVLSDAAMTEFERIVEQYPMSTNLSLQRLLRRKKPWST